MCSLIEQSASASSVSSLSLAASLLLLSPAFSSGPGTGAARDDIRTKSTQPETDAKGKKQQCAVSFYN